MTLNTFFEKFALFADAPDAVGKMRELVLRLALHGGFSGDDSTLWKSAELGDLLEVQNGFAFKSSFFNEVRQGMPLIRIRDIASEDTQVYYSGEYRDEFIVRKGDLIIGMDGNFNIHRWKGVNALLNQRVCRLVDISPEIDQQFLFYFVQEHLDEIHRNTTYTTVKHISSKQIRAIEFPLPPLDEQKRIVAKVDELMALCDRLEAQQQEREQQHTALSRASLARFADAPTPANLQLLFHKSYTIPPADLRKSILTLAVQGKLVPQDPNDEPAIRVLERIDAAPKRAMRTRASDEGEGDEPAEFEPLFELPPGWEWAPFRRLPLHASVGLDRGRSMQGPDKAVGYFKMNNIRNSGGVDLSDLTRIDATPEEIAAFALADGDFLFNTRNSRELVGKTCVFHSSSDEPILNNNNILRVKFIEGFSPDFLDYWFRSPEGSVELEKLKSNTTNVCAIYQGKLSAFPCVVPPLAEQRRIVAKVEQLMTLVDALETQLAASRATAKNLLDSLVAELTNGSQKAS
jgi:type I restriction enzyme S subunit